MAYKRSFSKKAHFLPVKQRIVYKIALLVFKCINNIAPGYISKCIKMKSQPLQTLRTDKDYFLLESLKFLVFPTTKELSKVLATVAPWFGITYHMNWEPWQMWLLSKVNLRLTCLKKFFVILMPNKVITRFCQSNWYSYFMHYVPK